MEMGYRLKKVRNAHPARRLTQVGFILRPGHTLYSQSSVFSHIQHGLHSVLEKQQINTLFLGTVNSIRESGFRSLARLEEDLSGIAVMGEVDAEFLYQIKEYSPRLVLVAAHCHGNCHSVLNNETQTMELLVEHLFGLGHRSFAWINGNTGSDTETRRSEALRQALHRRGLTLSGNRVETFATPKQREGKEAAKRLLERFSRRERPTAWICYNGRMARGAFGLLSAHQIDVPGEVSLAACDGTYICEDEEPTLTGAYSDPEKMGALAADLLLQATGETNEVFTEMVMPAALTARESSGPARPS